MLVAWLVPLALAAEAPTIEVIADALPVPPAARPWTAPERVVVKRAAITVDGVREDAWDAVPDAPPLQPLRDGLQPRPERARVARDGGRLVVLLPRPAASALLLYDPDGTASAWWRVELGGSAPSARRCDATGIRYDRPYPMPTRTAPCEADPKVTVAVGEAWVEVGFPPGLTTSGRLLWGERGVHGGSWANGGLDPMPETGRALDLGLRTGFVELVADPVARVLRAKVVPGADAPRGRWSWASRFLGRTLGAGAVDVPPDVTDVRAELPWTPRQHAWLEVRAGDVDGVGVTLVQRLWWADALLWPTSPVVADAVELRWVSPLPLKAVPLVLADGRRRWRGKVDLPAGSGRVRIGLPKGWRDPTVSALPLMPATRLVR